MKKVIRLSESDLVRLVKRVINEQFHSEIDTTQKSGENELKQKLESLKSEMENISILPDNRIDATKYEEKAIIESLKTMGYVYKKAIGNKLHFFNKETSISLYLLQGKKIISLVP